MIRDIKIKAVLNGFIVECGCQTLVCEDADRLTKSISAYLKAPDVVEKEWLNNSINSKHTQVPTVCVSESETLSSSANIGLLSPGRDARTNAERTRGILDVSLLVPGNFNNLHGRPLPE